MGSGGGSFGGGDYIPSKPTMPSEKELDEMTPEEKEARLSQYQRQEEAHQEAISKRRSKRLLKFFLVLLAIGVIIGLFCALLKCAKVI
ncbi:MAG: hypothetical protein MJ213_00500 [Bacilli bacterium]|nr:hypothetical protein [Bacilli bacterium]